jgi:3-oxoacyl-[acyl-carrier protein] reductase
VTGRLDDRVVIVTGGAQGLGRAYSRHLVAAGARVVVADLASDEAQALATELDDRAIAVTTDVTDESSVAAMADAARRRWGRVDALVNNAGGAIYPTTPVDQVGRAQWDHVLAVNLVGPWLCTVAVLPLMRDAGYGKIVNVCSSSLFIGGPVGLTPYIAAKGGVLGLTRALARELGPDGIRVNAVSPGWVPVDTPKKVHAPEAQRRLAERMVREQCLPRVEEPQDLCGTVEFLCSADSDFVTGQVLNVDGGWSLH